MPSCLKHVLHVFNAQATFWRGIRFRALFYIVSDMLFEGTCDALSCVLFKERNFLKKHLTFCLDKTYFKIHRRYLHTFAFSIINLED